MKTTGINFIAMAACVLCLSSAKAAITTASWNFTGASGSGPYSGVISPTGSGSLLSSASLAAPAGSSISTVSPIGGGGQGGTGDPFLSIPSSANSGTLIFTLSASGQLTLTTLSFYDQLDNKNNSPQQINWQFKIGSGTFTSLGSTTFAGDTTWDSHSFSLSAIGTVASGSTITIEGTLAGAGNAGINFDTIAITAVPEPVNYALAGFGILFVGGSIGRFYLARRRSESRLVKSFPSVLRRRVR